MMRRWLLSLLLAPAVLAQAPPPPPVPQAVAALAHLRPRADAGPSSWTNGPYDYDDAGNITWIGSESYVYDKLSRLRTAILRGPDLSAMQTQTFQYDVYGNLISTSKLGQTVPLPTTVATNRLESLGYDASGNVTAAGTVQYAYDAVGMLNTVRVGSSAQPRIIYGYTADDERLFAFDVSTGVTHWTLRGLDNKVLRDFKQQGSTWSVERDYVYRDGFLLAALKSAGAVEHYTLDHLGTPRLITDGSGQKVGYHVYWPFGEEWTAGTSQDGAPLKFTGHERDADPSGGAAPLDYMHARYYGAGWGRFLAVDPVYDFERVLSQPQGWNRYVYVENNPVNQTDPNGKCTNAATCAWDATKVLAPLIIRAVASASGRTMMTLMQTYAMQRLSNFEYAKPHVMPPAMSEAHGANADTREANGQSGAQDKKLSGAEIDALETGAEIDVHDLKKDITGDKKVSKYDLYKDKNGDIYVKPRNDPGRGEWTGYNINDYFHDVSSK